MMLSDILDLITVFVLNMLLHEVRTFEVLLTHKTSKPLRSYLLSLALTIFVDFVLKSLILVRVVWNLDLSLNDLIRLVNDGLLED